jgi:hypothetical protein
MTSKVKFNLLCLLTILTFLIAVVLLFSRTYASELAGKSVGFGMGVITNAPTALPVVIFAFFTRHWILLSAAVLGSAIYLLVIAIALPEFVGPGEWPLAIGGFIFGTTVGIAVLQILFVLFGNLLSKKRGPTP